MKHVVLVRVMGGQILNAQYMLSKFDREPGDKMTVDGVKWVVGCVGDSRNGVINAINEVIKKQKKDRKPLTSTFYKL
jgi:hypothetical protein